MSASSRWLVAAGAVVAAIVLGAVAVGAFIDREQTYPAGSAEAAVQGYLRAVADQDATTAFTYISDELVDECGEFPRESITQRGDYRFRATLVETIARDGTTEVNVEITERWGSPPFDGGDSTYRQSFVLIQAAGWRFSEVPWPLYCANPKPAPAIPANG